MTTYTATDATISFEVKGEYTNISSLIQHSAPINIWPYGKRWFLPHITGEVDWHRAIAAPDGEVTVGGGILNGSLVQDTRLHARALRWFWFHVWLPIHHRLSKRRELQP